MANAVPLPAGSTLGKSFEYGLDVNVGTIAVPSWQTVRRISDFNQTPTPRTQDAQTYDDLGADNSSVTGWSWALAFGVLVNRAASTGLYLPEIEALRSRTLPTAKGADAEAQVRWYHKPETGVPNPTDAGQGIATVAYARANTGADGSIEKWNVSLTGVGPYDLITNPFGGWSATVPTVTSALPTGAAAAALVTIKGTGFSGVTGAAGVKFGAVNATAYSVVDPTTIVATVPAGSAGSAPITVTHPTAGASTAFAYTRG